MNAIKKFTFKTETDSTHLKVYDFLNSLGRQSTEVLVIAVSELIDKYGLDKVPSDKLEKFVSFYDFIKNADETNIFKNSAEVSDNKTSSSLLTDNEPTLLTAFETLKPEKSKFLVDDFEKQQMTVLLSGFTEN